MTKERNRRDWIIFFKYGLLWLFFAHCMTMMICFVVSMEIEENGSYLLVGTLSESFQYSVPVMIIGTPFYCVGFAARGREKKSIAITLEEKDDEEKMILLGIIAKSMKKRPALFSWQGVQERERDNE